MSDLNAVGDQDNWTCWLCDKPVDPDLSVNNDQGPSVDSYGAIRVKKGGREIIARCPDQQDAEEASAWLLDRISRLAPELNLSTQITAGGGQVVLALKLG